MPQRPDVKLLDDVHQPAAMVGVGVGQHHQVEVAPARASQPPHGGGVGPTVNEDRRAGRFDEHGVALADVDRGHGQAVRRRPGTRDRQRAIRDGGRRHQCCESCGPLPRPQRQPRQHARGSHQGPWPQRRNRPADRPQAMSGSQDDREWRPRRRHNQLADAWMRHRPDGGDAAHHGRRGRSRDGHQVRRNGRQPQLTVVEQQQRRHGRLRPERDRDQTCSRRRQPRQASPDAGRDGEHAGRSRRRQEQTQRPRQHGVHDHEQQHHSGQHVHRHGDHAARLPEQHDRGHGSGAQDARLEPGQKRVGDQHQRQQQPPAGRPDP